MRKYLLIERLSLLFIVLFGFLVRLIPFLDRLKESPILFYQPDNCYYVRRVLTILYNFPHIPMADIYLSYPKLSEFPSPPFYSVFLAFLSYIFGLGNPTEHTVELTTSLVSAFTGAMVAIPIYLFAKKIFERRFIAIACALVSTMVPTHYWYTNAFDGDHHAIEVFLTLTAIYFLGDYIENRLAKVSKNLFILFTAALFLVWQGAILYLGLMVIFVVTYSIVKRDWQLLSSFGFQILIIALIILSFNLILPPYTEFVSYGRYSFFSAFAVFLVSFAILSFYFSINKKFFRAILSFILLFAIFYLLKEELLKGFLFIAKKEKGFISILEMKSILDLKFWTGSINKEFFRGLGYFFYLLFPPFLILFLVKDRRFSFSYTLFFIVAFALLSYNQRRFGYIYGPLIALSFFYFWDKTYSFKKGIIGIIFIIPILATFIEGVSLTKRLFDNIINTELRNAYIWMRNNTPLPSPSVFDYKTLPKYTVYAPWYQGYYLVHIAQRPVFANNALLVSNQEGFIDSVKISITNDLNVFSSLLDKYNVRYIVIPGVTYEFSSFEFIRYPYIDPPQRVFGALFLLDGKFGKNYLGNFRLIADFINPVDGRKRVKIFEYVKGAKLKIHVGRDKEVSVNIKIRTPFQRIIFTQTEKGDNEGYVFFTIPYSTGVQGMTFTEHSVINIDSKKIPLYVSESAVLDGKSFEYNLVKAKPTGVNLD